MPNAPSEFLEKNFSFIFFHFLCKFWLRTPSVSNGQYGRTKDLARQSPDPTVCTTPPTVSHRAQSPQSSKCEVLERLRRPAHRAQGPQSVRGFRASPTASLAEPLARFERFERFEGFEAASMAEKTFLSFLAHILAPNTCRRHGFSPSNSSPKRASHGRTFDAKRPLNPYNKRLFFPLLPRAHSLASARFWSVSNGQSGRTIGKVRGV